ncbi:hypothetical protein ACEQ8H_000235 [Pleosporales sp. CAS-2024a]
MSQTNILVTGGCGLVGTSLISALLSTQRFSITALDINPPALGTSTYASRVRYVRASVLDGPQLAQVFAAAQPAVVVHTVGVYPLGPARYATATAKARRDRDAVFATNVDGTRNVLDAARGCGARALVYTSSVTVVFDDLGRDFRNVDEEQWPSGRGVVTAYGQSKSVAEAVVLAANGPGFATCALRSAPIFGPHDAVLVPRVHALIGAWSTPFVLGKADNLQDYVYVDNVADAHVLAVDNLLKEQTAAGHAMFITNGEPVTLRDLCLAIWKEFGHVPPFTITVPERIAWCMGLAAEWGLSERWVQD